MALNQTQPLTQTQLIGETQPCSDNDSDYKSPKKSNIWGKLFPVNEYFVPIELTKDVTTFGRRDDCDVKLINSSNLCDSKLYSMMHFTIRREFSVKTGYHTLLEDNSSNGTFISGEKLGKGRIQALKNNTEIALCRKDNKAYMFIDYSNFEEKWPLEITKNYTITKELGKGAYGEVRLAFEKNTCERFAVKIISKKKFTINGKHQLNAVNQIKSEIDILKKLEHPCIIKIKEVIESNDFVFIILEIVEGGELFDKVVSIDHYDEKTAKLIFYQMVLAIKYLHDKGITHRDLKPENILLSSPNENETLIKVTDFGLSKLFDATTVMKTFCGTPNYLAPEVLISRGSGKYDNKIDNWSLGVILYICLVGYPPFSDDDKKNSLEEQIKKGLYDFPDEFWSNVSNDAKDVIKRLMCVDSTKRATLEEILEHKWIKNDIEMKTKVKLMMEKEMEKYQIINSNNNGNNSSKKRDDFDDKEKIFSPKKTRAS